ncbi:MAG: beta-xylosidase [Actinobacteria bacterium]|nr:beta-xylosidase [Actinomycetota bacterium]
MVTRPTRAAHHSAAVPAVPAFTVVLAVLVVLVAGCAGSEAPNRADPAAASTRPSPALETPTDPRAILPRTGPAEARRFTVTGDRAGFAHGFELNRAVPPADVERDLDLMAGTGARWLRATVDWGHVEPTPGGFDWTGTDRVVDGARARGMSVVAVVTYAPPWAADPRCRHYECAPQDPDAFGAFAGLVAARYAPRGVHHFEVWNEPNHAVFWSPGADASAYARTLVAASRAIRAADPEAIVISGGLSPGGDHDGDLSPLTFLRRVYDAGAGPAFDAVAHHPYQYPNHPLSPEDTNAFRQTERLHLLMAERGDGDKRIWGTEVGAPTRGSGAVSEHDQAEWLRAYYDLWDRWKFTGPLLWFSARDKSAGRDVEDAYGLVRHDRTPKPALEAFVAMVEGSPPVSERAVRRR